LIEHGRFNVFLTGDKNMQNQQRLDDRPFAVLIMSAINWPVAFVVFRRSAGGSVRVITARDMDASERRLFRRK
jgi:uncharacterized DUF497 family protein